MNTDIYYKIIKYQQKLELEPNNSIYQYKLKYYYQMVGGQPIIYKDKSNNIIQVNSSNNKYKPGTCIEDNQQNVYKLSFYKQPFTGADYYKMKSLHTDIKDDAGPISNLNHRIVKCPLSTNFFSTRIAIMLNNKIGETNVKLTYIFAGKKDKNIYSVTFPDKVNGKIIDKSKKTLTIGDKFSISNIPNQYIQINKMYITGRNLKLDYSFYNYNDNSFILQKVDNVEFIFFPPPDNQNTDKYTKIQ